MPERKILRQSAVVHLEILSLQAEAIALYQTGCFGVESMARSAFVLIQTRRQNR
jgi:hypothetical protein